MRTKYKFSHRAGGKYYWKARVPGQTAYEESVSANVLWFWGWTTADDSLEKCDCEARGLWGATGLMPDSNHVLVTTKNQSYLAHRAERVVRRIDGKWQAVTL